LSRWNNISRVAHFCFVITGENATLFLIREDLINFVWVPVAAPGYGDLEGGYPVIFNSKLSLADASDEEDLRRNLMGRVLGGGQTVLL